MKAHPAPDLFIGQVGDERDHDLGFRRPEPTTRSTRARHRTAARLPVGACDTTAKTAAALALAAERATGHTARG